MPQNVAKNSPWGPTATGVQGQVHREARLPVGTRALRAVVFRCRFPVGTSGLPGEGPRAMMVSGGFPDRAKLPRLSLPGPKSLKPWSPPGDGPPEGVL